MENTTEELIKALQVTIATKQRELKNTRYWRPLRRWDLRCEIRCLEDELKPLLRQAQGIRQYEGE